MITKFIKLNEVVNDIDRKIRIVNTACIQSIDPASRRRDTYIKMIDKTYFFVSDTIDEVWEMVRS